MKLYTTKELIDNTIFDYSAIRSLRNKNYFVEIKYIDGKYCFSENDFKKLMLDSDFCSNAILFPSVVELLGIPFTKGPKYAITKYNLQENKDYKYFNSKYYFNKNVIEKIANRKKEIDTDVYLSIAQCNKEFSKKNYIYDGIRKGYLKSYTFSGTKEIFITKNDFNKVKEELNIIDSYYSANHIADYLGVGYYDLSREKLLKLNPMIIRKRLYFNKSQIDKIYQKYKTPTEAYNNYFGKAYKVETRKKSDVQISSNIPTGYLTITEMCEKFNTSRDVIMLYISKKQCKSVVNVGRTFYMNPSEYETILNRMNESISVSDIYNKVLSETGIKLSVANIQPLKSLFPTAFMWNEIGIRHYRVPIKDFEEFMKSDFEKYKIKYLTENEKDAFKVFEILFSTINNYQFKTTLNEFKFFAINVLNKSHSINKKLIAYALYSTLSSLISFLNKEFNELNDTEIENIILKLSTRCKLHFTNFLNGYRKLHPNNCNYYNDYNNYTLVETADSPDQFYSREEWFKYLNYLCDVDIHIIKAFENQSYARRWLYLILHFCSAFRKSTFSTLPNIVSVDFSKYNLQWFKENHFSMADAQYIVNNAKLSYDNTYANKNSIRNHFIVYPCMIIPVAIAFICAEKHSQLKNNSLIGKIPSTSSDFTKYFANNMNNFSSLKANRTLMTYCYIESSSKEGYSGISYMLTSVQRGHTLNKMGISQVSHQYIYTTNQDGDSNNIAYQLQRRGVFGWLYKAIINITSNGPQASISETTNNIEELKAVLSAKNIEGISKFLENENYTTKSVISELLSMNSSELQQLVEKLSDYKLPSKIDYTQCIKSGNCPYPLNTGCYACRYSIPTNYTLMIINTKLMDFLDRLFKCNIEDEGERIYYSNIILKLLRVINQAKKDFIGFSIDNKEYIDSFLNIDIIKDKFDMVKNTKLLII